MGGFFSLINIVATTISNLKEDSLFLVTISELLADKPLTCRPIQSNPDNLNHQEKSKKVRDIGSSSYRG